MLEYHHWALSSDTENDDYEIIIVLSENFVAWIGLEQGRRKNDHVYALSTSYYCRLQAEWHIHSSVNIDGSDDCLCSCGAKHHLNQCWVTVNGTTGNKYIQS